MKTIIIIIAVTVLTINYGIAVWLKFFTFLLKKTIDRMEIKKNVSNHLGFLEELLKEPEEIQKELGISTFTNLTRINSLIVALKEREELLNKMTLLSNKSLSWINKEVLSSETTRLEYLEMLTTIDVNNIIEVSEDADKFLCNFSKELLERNRKRFNEVFNKEAYVKYGIVFEYGEEEEGGN